LTVDRASRAMAPMSEAAASLVEAYLGRGDPLSDVASFLGKSSLAIGSGSGRPGTTSLQKQLLPQAPIAGLGARHVRSPWATSSVTPRSVCASNPSMGSRLLAGGFTPEVQAPRRAVSSDGAAVVKVDEKQLEDSIRIMAQCLQDGGVPPPGLLSLSRPSRESRRQDAQDDLDAESNDFDSRASSYGGGSQGSRLCRTELSHATTPSWRSRTFPPYYLTRPPGQAEKPAQKQRLPSLPYEARVGTPLTEVARLNDIASEVHEANALLVESFLNVKRRALPRPQPVSASGSGAASCLSGTSCSSMDRAPSLPLHMPKPPRRPRKYEQELGTLPESYESCGESASIACF